MYVKTAAFFHGMCTDSVTEHLFSYNLITAHKLHLLNYEQPCKFEVKQSVFVPLQRCELCPQKDGALKRTDSGGKSVCSV